VSLDGLIAALAIWRRPSHWRSFPLASLAGVVLAEIGLLSTKADAHAASLHISAYSGAEFIR
jgi:hypothetical protein